MLRKFLSYYRPYKKLFFLDFTSAILVAILELFFPIVVSYVTDQLLPDENWTVIISASMGLFALYTINSFLHYVVMYYGHALGINIENDMRSDLYDHLQRQSFSYFDNRETGELISRLTTDLFEISEVAHHGPEDIFITLFTLGGAFYLMLTIHVELAIITFMLVPLVIIIMAFFNRKMTSVNTQIYKDLGNFSAGIEASVGGIREVQAYVNEDFEGKQFNKLNQAYRKTRLLFFKVIGFSHSLNYFFIRLISLVALFFGAYYSIQGEITYGELVAFILFSNVFVRPIERINFMIESYPKGIAGFKRMMDEMNAVPTVKNKPNAKEAPKLNGHIEFKDVTFGYEDQAPVLDQVNLSIKAGQTVAFVGPSGAGKTTITSLIPRFYDVNSGEITIDGFPHDSLTLDSLRQQIGVVQQDVFLFPGTIKENILYGNLHASEEEIHQAVCMANLEDVIKDMPEGLDTVVGERGVKMSGGQKQRISIARMFLKNPSILILDEATSALDTQTERAIQGALYSLSTGRTTLVIAHRLATIIHADKIIVVTENGIVEEGTHEELLTLDGEYKALYDAQFGS